MGWILFRLFENAIVDEGRAVTLPVRLDPYGSTNASRQPRLPMTSYGKPHRRGASRCATDVRLHALTAVDLHGRSEQENAEVRLTAVNLRARGTRQGRRGGSV